jgi:uncharacterized protein YdeI (YjbR/CyaY-like superfamily)
MKKMNPRVDFFFNKASSSDGKPANWQEEFRLLREIALDCGLTEELKWGCPCYTYHKAAGNGKASNIVLIHGFKEYCALLFFKGALLKDPNEILIQQTERVQAARQIRFTSPGEIKKLKPALKAYIREAIEVEKEGRKVKLKKTTEFTVPEEFQEQLNRDPALKKAFKSLTPGRQRAYLHYFSTAKLSKTREERIKKYLPQILKGKGLDD